MEEKGKGKREKGKGKREKAKGKWTIPHPYPVKSDG
jgi:hypothetical protein